MSRSRASVGKITRLAVIAALVFSMLSIESVLAQPNPYAPNVTTYASSTVTPGSSQLYSNFFWADDAPTTGVTVLALGLTGISSVSITTESLNSPSAGVPTITSSGTVFYFDANVILPSGKTAPSGATVTVLLYNPFITLGETIEYWTGSAWATATGTSFYGSIAGYITIAANIPLSALNGNLAVVP